MSTQSFICKETTKKTYVGIYCHYDGYPEYVGKILLTHYNNKDKVEELLELGDLSSLGENIAPKIGESHSFENPLNNVCVAYHRDRGEKLYPARPITLQDASNCVEFMYVYMTDGTWYFADLYSDNKLLIPLTGEHTIQYRRCYGYEDGEDYYSEL